MTTIEIRNKIKEKRSKVTIVEIEMASKAVLKNLLTLDFIKNKTNFFIYNSIKNEVDTAYIIDYLKHNNKVISYPLTIGDYIRRVNFVFYRIVYKKVCFVFYKIKR